jgi:hypothetical protein
MKNAIFTSSLLMFAMLSPGIASADSFELNLTNKNIQLNSEEQSHKIISIGYRKQINDYLSLSGSVGRSLRDTSVRVFRDTYITDIENPEIMFDDYVSTESVDFQYGVDVMVEYPLANALSVYSKIGYVNSSWSSEYYPASLVDNQPSETPQSDFEDGASDCDIFGRESSCGVLPEAEYSDGSFDNLYWEAGLTLMASKRASVKAGYKRSFKGGISFDAATIGFSMTF